MPPSPNSLIASLASAVALLGALLAKRAVRLAAYAVIALVATWPLLQNAASLNGYRDSHPLVQYEEAARRTVLEFGQVPLWNPYYCGGLDGLGTPQSRFASPTFLLTLAVGTLRAEPIVVFLFMLLGLEGAFRYARSRGATPLGASLAAPLFALSGFFAVAPALGWIHFMGFQLVPWIVWGLRMAMRGSRTGAAVSALGLAAMVGFGGTYPAPMTALFCAFEVGEALWARRRNRERLSLAASMALLVAVLSLGIAAVRLWPVIETLTMAPRIIGGAPMTTPQKIAMGLLGRIKPDDHGDFPIAGNYLVGIFAAPAVLVGAIRRRTMGLATAGFLALWLASGYGAKISLFAALKGLPVYSTLRYPERFLVLFALAASALAAMGITRLQSLARAQGGTKRAMRFRLLGAAGLAVSVTLLLANLGPLVTNQQVAGKGRPMEAPPREVQQDFHQARGTRWGLAQYGPMSRGVLSCYDAYPVPQSPLLRGDLVSEEYLAEADAGSVKRTYWSPNRVELDVDVSRDTRVLVNQNWHPGWHASVGTVVSSTGLLAVDVPKGQHHLTLHFRPRSAVGGALVTLVSIGALFWILRRRRLGPAFVELGVATAAILATFGLAFALVKDSPRPPAELKDSNGNAVIVAALPPDATLLGVDFEGGMRLEAARMRPTLVAPEGTFVLDLYWTVTKNPDLRQLGVFVHLVPEEGDTIRADHVSLGEAIEPERAPTGVLIHDAAMVTIPHDVGNKTYRVWIGVWRVRGDAKRSPVTTPGRATIDKDRVDFGTFSVRGAGP